MQDVFDVTRAGYPAPDEAAKTILLPLERFAYPVVLVAFGEICDDNLLHLLLQTD